MNFLFLLLFSNPVLQIAADSANVVAQDTKESVAFVRQVADSENFSIEEAKTASVKRDDKVLCFMAASEMEEKYQIQKHLLSTIASVESGQYDYDREQYMAWPWTLNAQGKGYYFDTKEEAVAKAKELQQEGITSIDVGCMQINMKFHGEAFESIEDAFDPKKNVEYSAKFLTKLYKQRGNNWDLAAMAYHSKNPERGAVYKSRLTSRYEQLKVALSSDSFGIF